MRTTRSGMGLEDEVFRLGPQNLRTPARWALLIGALSLLPTAIDAGRTEVTSAGLGLPATGSVTVGSDGTLGQVTSGVGSALFVAAGVLACLWLVRLQRVTLRGGVLDGWNPESALWIMWVIPFATWVLPVRRLARLDRATAAYRATSRRPWALYAWAVLWVLFTSASYWDGTATTAYVWLVLATATFVTWSWVVLRLTDAGERLDATTTERRLAGPPATTSA